MRAKHVAVIGAGIVGVSTAIWLQRAGARVTLIDREGPAAGTSYGNAGLLAAASIVPVTTPGLLWKAPGMLFDPMKPLFLRWPYLPRIAPFLRQYLAHGTDERVERISMALTDLLADTVDQHQSLAAGTGAERYVIPCDYLYGYASKADFDADGYGWAVRERRGYRFQELTADELGEHDPALKGRFGHGACCPDHGRISDPGAYVTALHAHFLREGGTALKAEVTDISVENGRAREVITSAGPVAADDVALTMGAWSGPLARKFGVAMPLETERGYHIEFLKPSFTLRSPVMVASGKFLATPMEGRMRCAGVVEFGGLNAPAREAPFRMIEAKVKAIFPDLDYEDTSRWMGHRPSTTDSLPVIGPAPGASNLWLGYGHQHIGLTGGPKTGRWLAQMIAGERPNTDLTPFNATRSAVMEH